MELHMSSGIPGFKVVISPPAVISIDTLSKVSAETAAKRLGLEADADVVVKLSTDANKESKGAAGKGVSIAVQELFKRMKELQQLLRQQQHLAAVQAASYQSAEAKTTSVTSSMIDTTA
jgi:hypothetical protein